MTLREQLNDPTVASSLVADCCRLIDAEVADKKGLSGVAIKAGYKTLKGLKPGAVEEAVRHLLPEFAQALDPFATQALQAGQGVGSHLREKASPVAEALLGVTDRRADTHEKGLLRSTYLKLRPVAKRNVEAAVPRLAAVVDMYVGSAGATESRAEPARPAAAGG